MSSNGVSWNPMFPSHFALANEDHQVYLMDTRYLSQPFQLLKGHVSAVLSVDYSPLGKSIVSGGYDRTLRLYSPSSLQKQSVGSTSSASSTQQAMDVYHTRRMQRVWQVLYSLDQQYVISGSDEGVLRVWKSKASQPLGPLSQRHQDQLLIHQQLMQKYAQVPKLQRIASHRIVPKPIKTAEKLKKKMTAAKREKEQRAWIYAKQAPQKKNVTFSLD
ncbi:rRNA-processing protein sof1 [Coelomomyces lativittatus]|nr:rRNA-processing protein sof1 [Coelomomyces lativittatus]KAJ1505766.1 rRNA-processing protein sof1 [Coelomomyces lativittatus]